VPKAMLALCFIKVLSTYYGEAYLKAIDILNQSGCEIIWGDKTPDLIICPDYDSIIPEDDLRGVKYGALVFHPSPLPRMKGRNAIKRQYAAGDKIGGGTWFWASASIDRGDICEQEITLINPGTRPRDYYKEKILPIMARGLVRAITGLKSGHIRKIPQAV